MRTVRALIELVRLDRTAAAAGHTVLGAYLAGGLDGVRLPRVWLATAIVACVVAFGFALNDCCGTAVDAVGRPSRPLPSGRLTIRGAIAATSVLGIASLALATSLGLTMGLFALGTVGLSVAYSVWLKGTLFAGNAAMALLVAAIPVYGGLAAGAITPAVWAAAGMIFPYILAQEILYDVEDEPADSRAGLRTTAQRLGAAGALRAFALVTVAFVAAAIWPWLTGIGDGVYLGAALVCVVGPALLAAVMVSLPQSAGGLMVALVTSRVLWVSSVVPLVLLR